VKGGVFLRKTPLGHGGSEVQRFWNRSNPATKALTAACLCWLFRVCIFRCIPDGAIFSSWSAPRVHPTRIGGTTTMLLLIILIVLIFGFGYGGYRAGPGWGYYGGGGLSLLLTIVLILLLLKLI
jgi:hypothetical protein